MRVMTRMHHTYGRLDSRRRRFTGVSIPVITAIAILVSAAIVPPTLQGQEQSGFEDPALSPQRRRIVEAAATILGRDSLDFGERQFNMDCSGTVMAAYYGADMDLTDAFHAVLGGGVARLYRIAAEAGVLFDDRLPLPGDVVFFDNTWDADENGVWDDELTHAALVVDVDDDGTISYLHHNYRRGIVIEKLNLSRPENYVDSDGGIVNSPMRMASDRYINPDLWLSSHLVREFASLSEIVSPKETDR
jgi:hypothetical protein